MPNQSRLLVARQLVKRLMKRQKPGFTLIELLVVVVIIGILASIALPSFVGAQDKARNASVQANVNTVRLALEQYSTDNNGSYPVNASFFAVTPSGLSGNNYLPGNRMPRSPWCKTSQTVVTATIVAYVVGPPVQGTVSASALAAGTAMATLPSLAGAVNTGTIVEPPGGATNYGFIMYDNDPASQTYTVAATGKRNKDPIICAQTTNNGN